jgi:plastocyanin
LKNMKKGDPMRRIFALLIIISFALALGCAKQAPEPVPGEQEPSVISPVPGEVPEEPAVPVEPEPEVPVEEEVVAGGEKTESQYTAGVSPSGDGGIGTRVEGTEQEAIEAFSPEDAIEVSLFANKTMSMSELTVESGTTVFWKSYDSWPHILAVETGSGYDTIRHARSERLLEGNVWNYTFEETGTFLVRDIFSGPMRMYVTVE